MSKTEELKHDLDYIIKKIGEMIEKPTEEMIDEISFFYQLGIKSYNEEVYKKFWKDFRIKYDFPELKDYFENHYMLLRAIFNFCIKPYHSKLDTISYKRKHRVTLIIQEKRWRLIRFFTKNWIIIISIIVMILCFYFANTMKTENELLHNILISIGTGVLVAGVISYINSFYKKKIRQLKEELNKSKNEFNFLRKEFEKLTIIINGGISDIPKFVQEFDLFNYRVEIFLNKIKDINIFKTFESYYKLKDLKEEINNYIGKLVNNKFCHFVLDLTTVEESAQLQIYGGKLAHLLYELDLKITGMENTYIADIVKMEDKIL